MAEWLSLDTAVNALCEVLFKKDAVYPVLNIFHPRPVPLNQVWSWFGTELGGIGVYPDEEDIWEKALCRSRHDPECRRAAGPALASYQVKKIPNYFRAVYDCRRAMEVSDSLASAPRVSKMDVEIWVKFWRDIASPTYRISKNNSYMLEITKIPPRCGKFWVS